MTPVCDGLVGETFWIVAQRGRDSGYVKHIEANPCVRDKVNGEWRAGRAHILDDDDPRECQRTLGRGNLSGRLCLRTSNAMSTSLLSVRIVLVPR